MCFSCHLKRDRLVKMRRSIQPSAAGLGIVRANQPQLQAD